MSILINNIDSVETDHLVLHLVTSDQASFPPIIASNYTDLHLPMLDFCLDHPKVRPFFNLSLNFFFLFCLYIYVFFWTLFNPSFFSVERKKFCTWVVGQADADWCNDEGVWLFFSFHLLSLTEVGKRSSSLLFYFIYLLNFMNISSIYAGLRFLCQASPTPFNSFRFISLGWFFSWWLSRIFSVHFCSL